MLIFRYNLHNVTDVNNVSFDEVEGGGDAYNAYIAYIAENSGVGASASVMIIMIIMIIMTEIIGVGASASAVLTIVNFPRRNSSNPPASCRVRISVVKSGTDGQVFGIGVFTTA